MDTLPVKFRSPPPKPPRRRHSDQLSVSPSGTFPSSLKKDLDKSQCSKNNHHVTENHISNCGSLPTNWSSDYSLGEECENHPLSCNKYANTLQEKNYFQNYSAVEDFASNKQTNSFSNNMALTDSNKCLNLLCREKFEHPYIQHLVKENVVSSKPHSKNILEFFHIESAQRNNCRRVLNDKSFGPFTTKSIFKEYHRRHHSDPLPYNSGISNAQNFMYKSLTSNSFLDTSSLDTSNKLSTSTISCEVKENQCLLEEVKSLKEINCKLWEHLCSTQATLERLRKKSSENSDALSASGILSSLYNSLKAKDFAMEDRMQIILKERDQAIQDLDNMVQVVARSFDDNLPTKEEKFSDQEVKELLQEIEITCNPTKLLQQQRLLLGHLYRSKELKQDHIMHELRLTTLERDHLREKVKLLEEELSHLKFSNEVWDSDNKHWENSLLNILCQVIQQRDMAVKNGCSQNSDYFNFRSPGHEKSFDSEHINECLQRLDGASVKKKVHSSNSQNDIKKYSAYSLKSKAGETRVLKEEILSLNKSLEIEMEKREIAEDKCVRLERLVSVLQKKINGQNVGVPV